MAFVAKMEGGASTWKTWLKTVKIVLKSGKRFYTGDAHYNLQNSLAKTDPIKYNAIKLEDQHQREPHVPSFLNKISEAINVAENTTNIKLFFQNRIGTKRHTK
jgi:hypothetical protein